MTTLTSETHEFNFLLANFVNTSVGVHDAVVVSSDGLLIATSDGLERAAADRLSAVVSGMSSLARSASRSYTFDGLKLIMIEMKRGYLLISAIDDGSCLGVIAGSKSDIGLVGYEVAVLAERIGAVITPTLISELRVALAS